MTEKFSVAIEHPRRSIATGLPWHAHARELEGPRLCKQACLSCAPRPSCRDTKLEVGSSPLHLIPCTIFLFTHSKINTNYSYYYKGYWNLENLQKCIYYTKTSLITTLCSLHNTRMGFFYPEFYKIQDKAEFGLFFTTEVLPGCIPSPGVPSVPEIVFPLRGEQFQ